jgi:hypothetical protein
MTAHIASNIMVICEWRIPKILSYYYNRSRVFLCITPRRVLILRRSQFSLTCVGASGLGSLQLLGLLTRLASKFELVLRSRLPNLQQYGGVQDSDWAPPPRDTYWTGYTTSRNFLSGLANPQKYMLNQTTSNPVPQKYDGVLLITWPWCSFNIVRLLCCYWRRRRVNVRRRLPFLVKRQVLQPHYKCFFPLQTVETM